LNPLNISQQNTTKVILDPELQAPYTTNGMFAIEQQLPKALIGSFSYNFNRGIHLFRTRNINAPFPGTTTRPDPTQGNINSTESAGKSFRQEMAFGLSRRFSSTFLFFGNYRWRGRMMMLPSRRITTTSGQSGRGHPVIAGICSMPSP
jgi:hypothetical protein